MAQTWVARGKLRPTPYVSGLGTAATGSLLSLVNKTVTVPITPTQVDTSYLVEALPYGGDLLGGAIQIVGFGTKTTTSVQVVLRNTGLVTLTGGTVDVKTYRTSP